MRALKIEASAALEAKAARVAILAEFVLATTHRFWSGAGTLSYGGNNWTGVGRLGRISGAGETAEIRTTETGYELAGISDFASLNDFISAPIRGYRARAWLAFLDEGGVVIADPVLLDDSVLDTATPTFADDGTATLRLNATSAMFYWPKPVARYITHEDQQEDYPGDTGFNRIPTEVAAKQVAWTPT